MDRRGRVEGDKGWTRGGRGKKNIACYWAHLQYQLVSPGSVE